jgi:hypothetical protein
MINNLDKTTLERFKKIVLDNFSDFLRQYNFNCTKERKEQYFYEIIYTKQKLYIKFVINIKPEDYPPYFNVVLGEGSIDWPDADWNSIALWHYLKQVKEGDIIKNYSTEGLSKLNESLKIAKEDLTKFGKDFLKGDLASFYQIRKNINQKREPYKIYTKNKDGSYLEKYDDESVKLKEKYT